MGEFDGTELVDWRELPPGQRRAWWEQLWHGTVALSKRYRLALRSGWWDDALQVEALAAFICWLRMYDTGANGDPTGKIQLLWELERLRGVLRAGEKAFEPTRDREEFERHLASITHPAPHAATNGNGEAAAERIRHRQVTDELAAVEWRLGELRQREAILMADRDDGLTDQNGQAARDLVELGRAIRELEERRRDLRRGRRVS